MKKDKAMKDKEMKTINKCTVLVNMGGQMDPFMKETFIMDR